MKMSVLNREDIMVALSGVNDPEINIPITDLGLVYKVEIEGDHVIIDFSLTSPGCPLADYLENEIKTAVSSVDGVGEITTNLVWTPYWGPELMNEEAKLSLGYSI
jgi:metal-sulfur cluster biosynthetic enzyme